MKTFNSSFFSILFLVFLVVGCQKSNSEWVKVQDDKDGNTYSYRKVNVHKESGNYMVQIWLKKFYSDKGRDNEIQERTKDGLSIEKYDKLSDKMFLIELDCNKKMKRVLSLNIYDKDGNVIISDKIEEYWDYIVPDTMGDNILKQICK